MPLSGRERAYEFVKREVLTDPGMQGQFINEQILADRIGVSRTPIREALLMLAAQELVQLVPKRGAYIAAMSGRELTELIEVRGLIERHAVTVPISEPTLSEMREALAAQHVLRAPTQAKEFIEMDTRFHNALVRATGNEILTRTYEGLRDRQVRAGMVALCQAPGRQQNVLDEHQEIVDCLAAGDIEGAVRAVDAHLQETLRVQLRS